MTTATNQSVQLSNNIIQVFKFDNDKSLKLQGMNIISRKEDGYINLNQLCKAGGKEFKEWKKNKKAQEFLVQLEKTLNECENTEIKVSGEIPPDTLIKYNTGSNTERANWGHPQVAINVAQWISPEFDVKVSKWIFELMLTGKVTLGQEKSQKELEHKFQEQIQTLQCQLTKSEEEKLQIMHRYNSRLQKHRYHKFQKQGPCFYIITQGLEYKDNVSRIKIGIAGCTKRKINVCPECNADLHKNEQSESFDGRLQNHRTLWPQLEVKFAVYTEDADILERCMKRVYKDAINPGGHEIIERIDIEDVISETKKFLNIFNTHNEEKQYLIEENIEDYNKISATALKEQEMKKQITEVVEEVINEVKEEIVEKNNEIAKYQEYLQKLDFYNVAELTTILKDFGLIQKGLKKDKQDRIKDYAEKQILKYNADVSKHSDKEILEKLSKYTYEELKKIATKYNLIQRGTCNDLCQRIREYLEQGVIDSSRRKDVFQYDSSGKLIRHWKTITELSLELNICKNFISKILDQKCLSNGYIWMSKRTVFTIDELKKINSVVKKTRKNLTKDDHNKIIKKYKEEVQKGERPSRNIMGDFMVEYSVSLTQIRRILTR
jgi:hypothetical protein